MLTADLQPIQERFQHTAARRRLGDPNLKRPELTKVSTHSRPKAAGSLCTSSLACIMFQHTAARRRLAHDKRNLLVGHHVSTHSRPKAAGPDTALSAPYTPVSTHSRPKAAGDKKAFGVYKSAEVSTHSRPKAAGYLYLRYTITVEFQHTAARRRLEAVGRHLPLLEQRFNTQPPEGGWAFATMTVFAAVCFNTQPPEGGWAVNRLFCPFTACFNTQPPEGGWFCLLCNRGGLGGFNTQPPEGGWQRPPIIIKSMRGFNTQPPEGGWPFSTNSRHLDLLFQHTAARRRLD